VVKKAAWRPPDTDCSKKLQEEDRGRKGQRLREVSVYSGEVQIIKKYRKINRKEDI
jgi:hypothetical protein